MSDRNAASFEEQRRTLEGIAYRMLGTLADARDVVQETYLKWREVDVTTVESPRAWLITACTRLALNQLKSARAKREVYVGEWLPEPRPDEPGVDPARDIEIESSVSMSLLLALEKLSPPERAVFLLHDVFELGFDEIAGAIRKSPATCRQLATRARKRVHDERPRFRVSSEEHRQLLEGFFEAARQPSLDRFIALLAHDVEIYSDGGGKVRALPAVLRGAGEAARFFVAVFSGLERQGVLLRGLEQRFNGSAGLLLFEDGALSTAITIEAEGGRIHRLYAVRNPDKLEGLRSAVATSPRS